MSKLESFKPLLPAEETLIATCTDGERVVLGDGRPTRLDAPSEDVEMTARADEAEAENGAEAANGSMRPEGQDIAQCTIRAELIRALLLDQIDEAQLHEKGLRIRGAFVQGVLDLQGVDSSHDLSLSNCILEKTPSFLNARLRGLFMSGSITPGILADNAQFDGSVFLRSDFQSTEEISLPGVKITGDLQICNAKISGKGRPAIFAPSLKVEGSIYLGDYPYDDIESELHSEGSIMLASCTIGQDFYCRNVAARPEDSQLGGALYLDLESQGIPAALSLARADIKGVLYMKHNQITGGIVNLSGATARRLNDEPSGEGAAYRLRLDGFDYTHFAQDADISLEARLDWLKRRPDGVEFSAQPYEQFARTLQSIGHRDEASHVLMRKEELKREANFDTLRKSLKNAWKVPLAALWDVMLRYLVGYGYRPIRALSWGLVLIVVLSFYFGKTWDKGDMVPNAAPILVSENWVSATQTHPDNPAAHWSSRGQAGQDYETFQPIAYAADLVIPIVNLGQEAAWAPSTSRSSWGWHGWWIRWVAKILGWVLTALGAAAITGMIRND